MQRRIFRIGGEPVVAARDGFFETHGTLMALIESYRAAAPESIAEAEVVPITAQVAPDDMEAVAVTPDAAVAAQPEVARPEQDGRDGIAAKPRKARTLRPKPPPSGTAGAGVAGIAAERPAAEATAAEIEAGPTPASRVRAAGRRAGQPTPPRWMVAGKLRRGRLT